MRRTTIALLGLVAVLAPAGATAAPGAPGAGAGLATTRQATAQFHDEAAAVAAGYTRTDECVEVPGQGGMGYHYIHFGLLLDPALDPARPEVLLYAPSGEGRKLVAVEWVQLYSDPVAEPPGGTALPSLFGATFDGWMPGHGPGMPWHADLHAWVWHANPAGVFAGLNPTIHC